MFPYFIGQSMPIGMKGLVIAAIYAAAQSSVSSGIAAATSGIFSDFYLRVFHGCPSPEGTGTVISETRKVWFSRLCALGLGLLVTGFACVFNELVQRGGLFEAFRKVVGIFEGLIIPIFILGMFSGRVGSLGVYLGALCGFLASFYWGFFTELGFGWNTVIAFTVTVFVAWLVSFLGWGPRQEQLNWLWAAIMARSEDRKVERCRTV